ncbi:MAG: hypothetical protein PHP03_03320 [Candidatus Pacebacteria bacterium]|nr:hypothetical protein [Candidatus Paceibacterota bacterium]
MKKSISFKSISLACFSLILLIGSFVVIQNALAWTNPSAVPPSGSPTIIYSNNNIGIGATPLQKLHVNGTLRAGGSSPLFEIGEDNNLQIYRDTTLNNLIFKVGGSDRMTIDANGNVGVGTTTPATQLYVAGKSAPTEVGSVNSNYVRELFVQGKYIYATRGNDLAAQIYDISTPSSPTLISSFDSPGTDIYVQGNYAYLAYGCLRIYDISNPYAPVLTSISPVCQGVSQVYVSGKYAYISSNWTKVQIIDVSDPYAQIMRGSSDGVVLPTGIVVQGKYAYLSSADANFKICDISNVDSPKLVGAVSTTDGNYSVNIQGKYAYVTTVPFNSGTFKVIDVSNPTSPSVISTVGDGFAPYSLYVQGNRAYIISYGNLGVYDISNPYSPINIGNVGTGESSNFSVAVQGRYAYTGGGTNGYLKVFDVGGAYLQQLETGGIETSTLAVKGNTQIYNDLDVKGGVQIASGLAVNGASSIFSTSTDAVLTLARKGATYPTVFKQGTDGALAITNNNTDNVMILKTGNVGVGTSTANHKLNVDGSLNVSGKIKEGGNDLLPVGSIMIWSGTVASIPTNWALCNGSNGTPDLRNKFVYGSTIQNIGGTGGTATVTLASANLPTHTHTIAPGNTGAGSSHGHGASVVTSTTEGNHRHNSREDEGSGSGPALDIVWSTYGCCWTETIVHYAGDHSHSKAGTTNAGSAHAHTISGTLGNTGAGSPSPLSIIPPYYQLAYIMKIN